MTSHLVASITPADIRLDDIRGEPCMYAVSLHMAEEHLHSVIEGFVWVQRTFVSPILLLGDGPYRITLRLQRGLSDHAALTRATEAGDNVLQALLPEVGGLVQVIRCKDILAMRDFGHARTLVTDAFHSDEAFRKSVASDANAYVKRQLNRNMLSISREEAVSLSQEYLLDEIAIYHFLAEHGLRVDAYLGNELPTLAALISGEILVSASLRGRVNIALKRKQQSAQP